MKKVFEVIGYAHVANDGRTVRVGFCEETNSWVFRGRKPHEKSQSICFSTEALRRILESITKLTEIPKVKEVIDQSPELTWKRYKPTY